MNKKFSMSWKSSKQPRKQRKFRYNAPLNIKNKFVSANLSKELRKKYGKRSISVKKGDKVKIMRGEFKGKLGAVEKVNIKKTTVYISGVEAVKKDGTKTLRPISPSNIMVMDIETDDKARLKRIRRTKK